MSLREESFSLIYHPLNLRVNRGGRLLATLLRVDHPDAETIAKGDPTLGWDGDNRLQLYTEPATARWELMRFEKIGSYSAVRSSAPGQILNRAWVNSVILDLIAHDHRRGFDAYASVMAHEAAKDAADERDLDDWVVGDYAPAMKWALKRGDASGHGTRDTWGYGDNTKRKATG